MDSNDLRIVLNAKTSLVALETFDEPRALSLLNQYFRQEGIPAWRWSVTEGVQSLGFGLQTEERSSLIEPEQVLNYIKKHQTGSAFVLCDLHPYIEEPKIIRLLKDVALNLQAAPHKVILVSHRLKLPAEVARYAAQLHMSLPSEEEILAIVREEARLWSNTNGGQRIKTDSASLQMLVNNLKGLPHQDVRRLAHGAIADDGAITDSDLPEVAKAKFQLMDMDGVLHFEYSTAHLQDVAGFNNLKAWLEQRREAVLSPESSGNQDPPKGVLLFGVQGGGKSLSAKAIAGIWGLPLLRLDMAALYDKYVGETERKLREALQLANVMEPCVLWMDELEKGMSQNDSSSALPKRLLGALLTWMAERKSRVFLVATSNDISQLPPELMRKGRFDEIFYIDLPDAEMREAIWRIHMKKRDLDSAQFDLPSLTDESDGYTGAEIEQALVSAIYASSAREEALSSAHILEAIHGTRPMSVIMSEQITALRTWAKERAVMAN